MYNDVDSLLNAIERLEKYYFQHRRYLNVSLDDSSINCSHEHEILCRRLTSFYSTVYSNEEASLIAFTISRLASVKRTRANRFDIMVHGSWTKTCDLMYEKHVPISQLIEKLVGYGIKEEPFLLFLVVLQCSRERVLHRDLSILLKAMRSVNCNK